MFTGIVSWLPGVHRLRTAIRDLNTRLGALETALHPAVAALVEHRADPEAAPTGPVPATIPGDVVAHAGPAVPGAGESTADLYRELRRINQREAIRHLPLILGDVTVHDGSLQFDGIAGASEDLIESMRFFVNGKACDTTDFPIPGATQRAQFMEIGGGYHAVRGRIACSAVANPEGGFFRIDAAPTGVFVEHAWRKAFYCLDPGAERFPVPPEAARLRVTGDPHGPRFLIGGAVLFQHIGNLLGELGKSWSDVPNVLDWGSGAGRLTRYLIGQTDCHVTGYDIDAENIRWCRQNLPGGRFELAPLMPPTPFDDAEFDLVIGISVVTHLSRASHDAWLAELQRMVKPGGLVMLSVRGPTHYAHHPYADDVYRALEQQGFVDHLADGALDDVIADGGYYRNVLHSRSFIASIWGRHFEILGIEDGVAAMQDLIVMRRRGEAAQQAVDRDVGLGVGPHARFAPRPASSAATPGEQDEIWSVSAEQRAQDTGWYWLAHPLVQRRMNVLSSGRPDADAYARFAEIWRNEGGRLPIRRALSVGCGFGALERDLSRRGIVQDWVAFDPASGAVAEARRLAQAMGLTGIDYRVGDLASLDLADASFDAVFAHQSAHHIADLAGFYARVAALLRPGGLIHLHEYVGPNHFQWSDQQLVAANEVLDSLPDVLKRTPFGQKPPITRMTVAAMIEADPTEGVQSEAILPLLRERFSVIEERKLGGTLAHLVLGNIAQNFDGSVPDHVAALERVFAVEDKLMAEGLIGSDFAVVTARRT